MAASLPALVPKGKPFMLVQVGEVNVISKTMHFSFDSDSDEEETNHRTIYSQSIDNLDLVIAKRKKRKKRPPLRRDPIPKLDPPKLMPQHIARRLPPALQFEARETRRKKRDAEDKARWAGYFENQRKLERDFKEKQIDKRTTVKLHKKRRHLGGQQKVALAKKKEIKTQHKMRILVDKEQQDAHDKKEAHERQLATFCGAQVAKREMQQSGGHHGLVLKMQLNLRIALNQKRQACWVIIIAHTCTTQVLHRRLLEFIEERKHASHRHAHANIIQQKWRRNLARAHMISILAETSAIRNIKVGLGWRVQFKMKTLRRGWAAEKCRRFFRQHRPQHICLVFQKFLLRVIRMQRWIRSFLATKNARLVLLRRCWSVIELGLKMNYDLLERKALERKKGKKAQLKKRKTMKAKDKKVLGQLSLVAEGERDGPGRGGVSWGDDGGKGKEDEEDEDEDEEDEMHKDRLVSVENFASISEVLDQFKAARMLFFKQEKQERKKEQKEQEKYAEKLLAEGPQGNRARKGSTLTGRKMAQTNASSRRGAGGRRGSFTAARPIAEIRRELLLVEYLRAERLKHASDASETYRDHHIEHAAKEQVIGTVTIEEMRQMIRGTEHGEKARFQQQTIREKQQKATEGNEPTWPQFMMLTQPECGRLLVDLVGAQLEEMFQADGGHAMHRALQQVHTMEMEAGKEAGGQGMDDMYAEMTARREEMRSLISGAEQQAKTAASRRTSDSQTVANEYIRREMRSSISMVVDPAQHTAVHLSPDPAQHDELQLLESAAGSAAGARMEGRAQRGKGTRERAERKQSLLNEIAGKALDELKSRRASQSPIDVAPEVAEAQRAALAKAKEEADWRQHQRDHEEKQKQLLASEKKLGNRKRRETKRVAASKAAIRRPTVRPANLK
jgi:hypothetical protein